MCVYCNTGALSCNNCCSGKAVNITYSGCACVFVALVIQHAMRMRHIAVCGLSGYTILFYVLLKGMIFGNKVIEYKMCVLIFSTLFV